MGFAEDSEDNYPGPQSIISLHSSKSSIGKHNVTGAIPKQERLNKDDSSSNKVRTAMVNYEFDISQVDASMNELK